MSIETRGRPTAEVLADHLGMDYADIMLLEPHSTPMQLEGDWNPSKPTILCDDTILWGKTVYRTLEQFVEKGGDPLDFYVLVDPGGQIFGRIYNVFSFLQAPDHAVDDVAELIVQHNKHQNPFDRKLSLKSPELVLDPKVGWLKDLFGLEIGRDSYGINFLCNWDDIQFDEFQALERRDDKYEVTPLDVLDFVTKSPDGRYMLQNTSGGQTGHELLGLVATGVSSIEACHHHELYDVVSTTNKFEPAEVKRIVDVTHPHPYLDFSDI
ncbi:MAG: hypothetical protein ABIC95_03765 [archaeon]